MSDTVLLAMYEMAQNLQHDTDDALWHADKAAHTLARRVSDQVANGAPNDRAYLEDVEAMVALYDSSWTRYLQARERWHEANKAALDAHLAAYGPAALDPALSDELRAP